MSLWAIYNHEIWFVSPFLFHVLLNYTFVEIRSKIEISKEEFCYE